MATEGKSSDDEDDAELKDVEEEINELSSAMEALFEKARPINKELDKFRKRKRECEYKRDRLRDKEHHRKKYSQAVKRSIELQSELERVKIENSKLKLSLHQGTKYSKVQKQMIADLESRVRAAEQARSPIVDISIVMELKEQLNQKTKLLNKTKEKLNGMRQHLSDVQERLTVSEQVTAATQQRALQESGNSQELQLELIPPFQPTTDTGSISVS